MKILSNNKQYEMKTNLYLVIEKINTKLYLSSVILISLVLLFVKNCVSSFCIRLST